MDTQPLGGGDNRPTNQQGGGGGGGGIVLFLRVVALFLQSGRMYTSREDGNVLVQNPLYGPAGARMTRLPIMRIDVVATQRD
jgi:hypothetical protein